VLSDTDSRYLERLRQRFAGNPQVAVVALRLPTFHAELVQERFDTIICLNVLEHVREDRHSLATLYQLLQPGGRLILLVPALPMIYGTLDRALGHFRRYTPAELRRKYAEAGFRMRHLEYFNLAGIPGWWFTGRVLRRELIRPPHCAGSMRWYRCSGWSVSAVAHRAIRHRDRREASVTPVRATRRVPCSRWSCRPITSRPRSRRSRAGSASCRSNSR
jgi:SAM-dependent methyltransferase